MTDRVTGDHRTTTKLGDVARWTNVAGETIPAHAVVQFKANFSSGYSQASKPDGSSGLFFANGFVDVAASAKGESLLWNRARLVLLDGSPTVGDEVGPTNGSWSMSSLGTGFRVIHQAVSGVGSVLQIGGGGSGETIEHGIVRENLGCGYYRIEKATWSGDRETAGYGSGSDGSGLGSGSGISDCDPCFDITGAGSASCAISLTIPPLQVTGTEVYVIAYDSASTLIPLVINTSVKMVNLGDTNSATGSGPGSGEDATPIWQILRGMMNHIVEYKERWDCCTGSGESNVETLIAKTPVILIGKECEEIICGTCSTGSGSGSGS